MIGAATLFMPSRYRSTVKLASLYWQVQLSSFREYAVARQTVGFPKPGIDRTSQSSVSAVKFGNEPIQADCRIQAKRTATAGKAAPGMTGVLRDPVTIVMRDALRDAQMCASPTPRQRPQIDGLRFCFSRWNSGICARAMLLQVML
jgi:hypothetical protein